MFYCYCYCHPDCYVTSQVELNKKRENEIAKLRKDMEEATIQHESILSGLKKKQGDAIGEMNEVNIKLNWE